MPLCALEKDNRVVFATTLLGTRELALVFRRRQWQWFSGGIYTIFTFLEGFLWNTPVVLLSASHLQDAHHKKNGNAYVYVIKLRKKSRRKRNPQPEAGWGFKVLFDSVSRSLSNDWAISRPFSYLRYGVADCPRLLHVRQRNSPVQHPGYLAPELRNPGTAAKTGRSTSMLGIVRLVVMIVIIIMVLVAVTVVFVSPPLLLVCLLSGAYWAHQNRCSFLPSFRCLWNSSLSPLRHCGVL